MVTAEQLEEIWPVAWKNSSFPCGTITTIVCGKLVSVDARTGRVCVNITRVDTEMPGDSMREKLENALRARSHDALMKGLAAEKAKLEE